MTQTPNPGPASPAPRRVLLIGGARSGKSAAAEARVARVAGPGGAVRYVATGAGRPDDAEWAARIAAHRARRPATWETVETADPSEVLGEPGVVLLDCVALWLTRAMDSAGIWTATVNGSSERRTRERAERTGEAAHADAVLAARVEGLLAAWRASPAYVVAVTNEVGMGVVPATPAGRRFRDELGTLNARLAAASDEVFLVLAGRLLPLEAP